VRVADIVPELRPLAANITYLCHWTALSRKVQNLWGKPRFYRREAGLDKLPKDKGLDIPRPESGYVQHPATTPV
jgi:hypothetical protein